MDREIPAREARQGRRSTNMLVVLIGSILLAVLAGLLIAYAFGLI